MSYLPSTLSEARPYTRATMEEAKGSGMADWLKESAKRVARRRGQEVTVAPTAEDLLEMLQALSGRKLHTRAEVRAYVREAEQAITGARRHRLVKEAVLVALVALSYLPYYFADVQLQILSLPSVVVFASERSAAAKP
jgi:hypothetical protein